MPTEYERAGFILAMRAVANDKAAILKARKRDFRERLASIRLFRRGLIEAHRAGYDGYPSIRREVRSFAEAAWKSRLGKSIMDETIVRPE